MPQEDVEVVLEQFAAANERGVVFLHATHSGRGRASGVEVGGETGYLYTVRDGLVARVELYAGRREALAAAGVSE